MLKRFTDRTRECSGLSSKETGKMRSMPCIGLLTLIAAGLAACDPVDTPSTEAPPAEAPPADAEAAAPVAAAAPAAAESPYKPVASVRDLMRGTIELAAETYWGSVAVVVDSEGEHEYMPETDEEWLEVWAAGLTVAEAGNLLLMPPRAVDEPEWRELALAMVDAGLAAAQVAADRDFQGMFDEGERIYNTCLECHQTYVPAMPDL
jgi:hypothetical protein